MPCHRLRPAAVVLTLFNSRNAIGRDTAGHSAARWGSAPGSGVCPGLASGLAKASARFATTVAMPPTGGGNGPSISTRTAGSEPTFIDDASKPIPA